MKLERRVRGKKDPRGYYGGFAEMPRALQLQTLQDTAGIIPFFICRYNIAKEDETDWDGSWDWNNVSFPWIEERRKEMVETFWACVKVYGWEF